MTLYHIALAACLPQGLLCVDLYSTLCLCQTIGGRLSISSFQLYLADKTTNSTQTWMLERSRQLYITTCTRHGKKKIIILFL